MGYIARTLAYYKRNGFAKAYYAVMERIDTRHMDYYAKLAKNYTGRASISESTRNEQKARVFFKKITFSILVPAYETTERYLKQLIEGVLSQTYGAFELIIADASQTDCVERVVSSYADERIKYVRLTQNKGISDNTNEALSAASGDYIGLLDHDDLLTEDALYEMAAYLEMQDALFVYSDEDKTDGECTRFFEPNYKPDFNLDYFMTNNYICHFMVMKAELMKQLQFRSKYDGAQDYDLILRAVLHGLKNNCLKIGHIPKVLYHWRCHQSSTADNPESKRYAYEAGLEALQDFIKGAGWRARASHTSHLGFYHVEYLTDIWQERDDIAAIGGNVVRGNIVKKSPKLGGIALFEGMHKRYTGYLHRSAMYMDVDELVPECMDVRENLGMSLEEAKQKGMRLLYDPHMTSGK